MGIQPSFGSGKGVANKKERRNKEIKKQRNKENKHINASQTFGIRVWGCIVDGLDLGELVGPSSTDN